MVRQFFRQVLATAIPLVTVLGWFSGQAARAATPNIVVIYAADLEPRGGAAPAAGRGGRLHRAVG